MRGTKGDINLVPTKSKGKGEERKKARRGKVEESERDMLRVGRDLMREQRKTYSRGKKRKLLINRVWSKTTGFICI